VVGAGSDESTPPNFPELSGSSSLTSGFNARDDNRRLETMSVHPFEFFTVFVIRQIFILRIPNVGAVF
jgi:hypothetical protein